MDNKNVFVAIALSMSVLLFWGAFFETPRQVKEPTNNKIVYDKLEFPIKEHTNSGTLLAEKLSRKYMSIK